MYSENMHLNDMAITDIDSYYDDEIYDDISDRNFWIDYSTDREDDIELDDAD